MGGKMPVMVRGVSNPPLQARPNPAKLGRDKPFLGLRHLFRFGLAFRSGFDLVWDGLFQRKMLRSFSEDGALLRADVPMLTGVADMAVWCAWIGSSKTSTHTYRHVAFS